MAVENTSVLLPVLDLGWLLPRLAALVGGRRATDGPQRLTKVAAKMDIEGAEFRALPPVIRSGSLCSTIDAMQVEVRPAFADCHSAPAQRIFTMWLPSR